MAFMKQLQGLLLFIPGTIWGVSYIVVELLLPILPPFTLTLYRTIISTIMLYAMLRMVGGSLPKTIKGWGPFVLLSLLNQSTPFALSTWGQLELEGGLTAILQSTAPLFTVLLAAWLTTDDKLTASKLCGVLVGLVGVIVLIGPSVLLGLTDNLLSQLAVISAAILYGFGAIYLRHVFKTQPTHFTPWQLRLRIVTAQFIAAAVTLVPFSLWFDSPWQLTVTPIAFAYLLFLGIGMTLLATFLYYYLVETLGATRASATMYLIPIAGVLAGVVVLGEALTPNIIAALVLILIGVVLVNHKPKTPVLKESYPSV